MATPADGTAPLYGLHVGRVCEIRLSDSGEFSSLVGDMCDSTQFSSWENIASHTGAR